MPDLYLFFHSFTPSLSSSFNCDQMQNEIEVLKAMGTGNKEALAILYEKYAPIIYGLALRVTESRDKAANVVKEVFQKLWQNASSFDSFQHDPFYWVMDVAKQVALANESRSEQFDFFAFQESNSAGHDLKTLLSKIDNKHRQVLELSYFRNLSEEQIESEMNIPIGTVATRLRIAIKALREVVG